MSVGEYISKKSPNVKAELTREHCMQVQDKQKQKRLILYQIDHHTTPKKISKTSDLLAHFCRWTKFRVFWLKTLRGDFEWGVWLRGRDVPTKTSCWVWDGVVIYFFYLTRLFCFSTVLSLSIGLMYFDFPGVGRGIFKYFFLCTFDRLEFFLEPFPSFRARSGG